MLVIFEVWILRRDYFRISEMRREEYDWEVKHVQLLEKINISVEVIDFRIQ